MLKNWLPFGFAVADFLGATFVALASALGTLDPVFLVFFGLSDSEAEEAELLVVRVEGKALVLGLLEGTFLAFFLVFSSAELLEFEESVDFFLESWEFEEESESLELSSLPDEELELELDDELPEELLPDEAEEDALLEPVRLGGIFKKVIITTDSLKFLQLSFYVSMTISKISNTDCENPWCLRGTITSQLVKYCKVNSVNFISKSAKVCFYFWRGCCLFFLRQDAEKRKSIEGRQTRKWQFRLFGQNNGRFVLFSVFNCFIWPVDGSKHLFWLQQRPLYCDIYNEAIQFI